MDDEDQVKMFSDISGKFRDNIKKKKKKVHLVTLKAASALST